jgi:hypothetical protein
MFMMINQLSLELALLKLLATSISTSIAKKWKEKPS